MKILYIDVNYKNSSTGEIVYNLNKCCLKHGIDSYVCYGRGKKVKAKNIFKFGLDVETFIHAFLTRITGYTGCYSFFSTSRLIRYIKNTKPDIVHIHELHAYFVNIKPLLIYLKKQNIPTVFTNHCEFLYTGKCGYSKMCNKYSNNCGKCPLLKEYPTSIIFDHTSYMLKIKRKIFKDWNNLYIVNPSNWLYCKTQSSFLKDKRSVIIHNGIDTNRFKFVGKKTTEKTVISIANHIFSKFKGGERVLDIARKMRNIRFILIGADKPFPKIPKNVEIYEHIKDKDKLAELYSNADCFLILSEYDNFPTTCIEAQCCGTKVIGYDVGGIKETIVDNCGVVVPYLDNDSVINELMSILNSEYDKDVISKKSIIHYSFDKMFDNYLKIYKELCH